MTMLLKIDEESMEIEERTVKLSAPRFIWRVIQARSDKLDNGDMELTLKVLFARMVMEWFEGSIRGSLPPSGNN